MLVKSRTLRSSSISWLELSKHLLFAANTSGSALFFSRGLLHLTEYTNQQQRIKVGIIKFSCHHHNKTLPGGLDRWFLNAELWDRIEETFLGGQNLLPYYH